MLSILRFCLIVAWCLLPVAGNSRAAGDHSDSHAAEPESLYLEINQQCPDRTLECYVPGLLKIASERPPACPPACNCHHFDRREKP
ncbi:MAG: hypothetical protein ACR2RB_02295 [Gammaproteobacteria bacterium]